MVQLIWNILSLCCLVSRSAERVDTNHGITIMHIYISTLSHSVSSLTRRRCAAGTALAERARLRSWGWYYQSFGSRFPKLVASSTSIILNGTSDAWPMRMLCSTSLVVLPHDLHTLPARCHGGDGRDQCREKPRYGVTCIIVRGCFIKYLKKSPKSQICLFF